MPLFYEYSVVLTLPARMNPEDSFLALRIFLSVGQSEGTSCSQLECLLETMVELISGSPQQVEKDELNRLLMLWIKYMAFGDFFTAKSRLLSHPHL